MIIQGIIFAASGFLDIIISPCYLFVLYINCTHPPTTSGPYSRQAGELFEKLDYSDFLHYLMSV